MKKYFLFGLSIMLLSSCVSQRKYDELLMKNKSMENRIDRLEEVRSAYDQLVLDQKEMEQKYQKEKAEKEELQSRYSNLNSNLDALNEEYNTLLNQNKVLLASATEERQAMVEELAAKENEIAQKEKNLEKLQQELAQKQEDLNKLQSSLMEREERITELNDQINSQRDYMNNLTAGIKNALMSFSDSDLTVTQREGRIYVSLSQQLLFAKGSDLIDSKGREAIIMLADVLKQNPDLEITVEGHTDSDGSTDRNWDLSVTRATSVVKILTKAGVNPERISAAGRAFFDPVVPNDNEANKSKNRRTEIILSPDLGKLYELIQN